MTIKTLNFNDCPRGLINGCKEKYSKFYPMKWKQSEESQVIGAHECAYDSVTPIVMTMKFANISTISNPGHPVAKSSR